MILEFAIFVAGIAIGIEIGVTIGVHRFSKLLKMFIGEYELKLIKKVKK